MKFKDIKWRGSLRYALTLLLLTSITSSYANLEGRWVKHPAAALRSASKEGQVEKIIDGNRHVYFSVRGSYWGDKDDENYWGTYTHITDIDPVQLFYYDKSKEWCDDNIRPLAQLVELSGNFHHIAEYSPEAGILAIVYRNNMIDFVGDDGMVTTCKTLVEATVPNQLIPFALTFDVEKRRVYIGCSTGFAVVDYATGELIKFHKLTKPVSWVGRVGTNMVIFSGTVSAKEYATSTYICPENDIPNTLTNPISGGNDLQALMPLTDSMFAALAPGNTEYVNSLKLFTISGANVVTGQTLVNTMTVDNGSLWRSRHFFRTDGFVIPTKDGYGIHCKESFIKLKRGNSINDLMTVVTKTGLSENETASKSATFDGLKFWFYNYDSGGRTDGSERGFYFREYDKGIWGSKSKVAKMSAPTTFIPLWGTWNPDLGVVVRGPGTYFENWDPDLDRICAYKDGKWTDLSFAAHNPQYVNPTSAAKFVAVDPINSNWIWGSCTRSGLFRIDLNDYNNFLQFGSDNYNSYKTTYPGYFPVFKRQADVWGMVINIADFDFDSKGNMWFARFWMGKGMNTAVEEYNNARTPIYYLTPEERMAIANIGSDESKLPDFLGRELEVKRGGIHYNSKLMACKAPGNENYLVICLNMYAGRDMHMIIYDHNGTPEIKSDDRYVLVDGLYKEDGTPLIYMHEDGVYEDLRTGEVWLFTDSGPYIFNPSELLDGRAVARVPSISENNGIAAEDNVFNQIVLKSIADDIYGRKWVATEMGLYCISADATTLLGHYTTSNSPLPSDNVYNVVCDGSNGAVFALTDEGIIEFQPEGSSVSIPAGEHLSIWPSTLTPDYNGYINITGAVGGANYVIYDASGNRVKTLGTPRDGAFQWDGKADSGVKVEKGRYTIKRSGVEESHSIIVL